MPEAARGVCPFCGKGGVIHLVVGMPADLDASERGPDWVHWVGCIHPGWDRECITCTARWSLEDGEVVIVSPGEPRA